MSFYGVDDLQTVANAAVSQSVSLQQVSESSLLEIATRLCGFLTFGRVVWFAWLVRLFRTEIDTHMWMKFKNLQWLHWLGLLPHAQLFARIGCETGCESLREFGSRA